MNFMLPHRFKIIGTVIAPIGFLFWLMMQKGIIAKTLIFLFGKSGNDPIHHIINVATAIVSFAAFLLGLYFITFSKEKIEDEMVQVTRLESFQFAALVQIICLILGFSAMLFLGDLGEGGMMLFLIGLIFVFWISYIGRFNYILHYKLRA